jgi:hypothetical protein
VPWFNSFLATSQQRRVQGYQADQLPTRDLNNAFRVGKVIDERNSDVQLMLHCPNFDIMATTFKWHLLIIRSPEQYCNYVHRDINGFLNHS